MNIFKSLFHIILILATGFASMVLWLITVALVKIGETGWGLFTMVSLGVLIASLVVYLSYKEEK